MPSNANVDVVPLENHSDAQMHTTVTDTSLLNISVLEEEVNAVSSSLGETEEKQND